MAELQSIIHAFVAIESRQFLSPFLLSKQLQPGHFFHPRIILRRRLKLIWVAK
jgi:hypothetical protein